MQKFKILLKEKKTDRSKKYDGIIKRASNKYDVPVPLIKAVIRVESNFSPRAVSGEGAQGLMQLMPGTARSLKVEDSFDSEQNIMGGTKYLSKLLKKFEGNYALALAGYHSGPYSTRMKKNLIPYKSNIPYIRKVMEYFPVYGGDLTEKLKEEINDTIKKLFPKEKDGELIIRTLTGFDSNNKRDIALYVPTNLDETQPVNLFIYFHGGKGGIDIEKRAEKLAPKIRGNTILAVPHLGNPQKSKSPDPHIIGAIYDQVGASLKEGNLETYAHSAGGRSMASFLNKVYASEYKYMLDKASVTFGDADYGWSVIDTLLENLKATNAKVHFIGKVPKVQKNIQNHWKKFDGDNNPNWSKGTARSHGSAGFMIGDLQKKQDVETTVEEPYTSEEEHPFSPPGEYPVEPSEPEDEPELDVEEEKTGKFLKGYKWFENVYPKFSFKKFYWVVEQMPGGVDKYLPHRGKDYVFGSEHLNAWVQILKDLNIPHVTPIPGQVDTPGLEIINSTDKVFMTSGPEGSYGTTSMRDYLHGLPAATGGSIWGVQHVSKRGGGKFWKHGAHQSGLNADISIPLKDGRINMQMSDDKYGSFFVPSLQDVDFDKIIEFLKYTAPQTKKIILDDMYFSEIKKRLESAGENQLLDALFTKRKLFHASGHRNHFHVHLSGAGHMDPSGTGRVSKRTRIKIRRLPLDTANACASGNLLPIGEMVNKGSGNNRFISVSRRCTQYPIYKGPAPGKHYNGRYGAWNKHAAIKQILWLYCHDVKRIFNVAKEMDRGVSGAIKYIKDKFGITDIEYTHARWHDFTELATMLNTQGSIYIHCQWGVHRSSTVLAGALMINNPNMCLEEAKICADLRPRDFKPGGENHRYFRKLKDLEGPKCGKSAIKENKKMFKISIGKNKKRLLKEQEEQRRHKWDFNLGPSWPYAPEGRGRWEKKHKEEIDEIKKYRGMVEKRKWDLISQINFYWLEKMEPVMRRYKTCLEEDQWFAKAVDTFIWYPRLKKPDNSVVKDYENPMEFDKGWKGWVARSDFHWIQKQAKGKFKKINDIEKEIPDIQERDAVNEIRKVNCRYQAYKISEKEIIRYNHLKVRKINYVPLPARVIEKNPGIESECVFVCAVLAWFGGGFAAGALGLGGTASRSVAVRYGADWAAGAPWLTGAAVGASEAAMAQLALRSAWFAVEPIFTFFALKQWVWQGGVLVWEVWWEMEFLFLLTEWTAMDIYDAHWFDAETAEKYKTDIEIAIKKNTELLENYRNILKASSAWLSQRTALVGQIKKGTYDPTAVMRTIDQLKKRQKTIDNDLAGARKNLKTTNKIMWDLIQKTGLNRCKGGRKGKIYKTDVIPFHPAGEVESDLPGPGALLQPALDVGEHIYTTVGKKGIRPCTKEEIQRAKYYEQFNPKHVNKRLADEIGREKKIRELVADYGRNPAPELKKLLRGKLAPTGAETGVVIPGETIKLIPHDDAFFGVRSADEEPSPFRGKRMKIPGAESPFD